MGAEPGQPELLVDMDYRTALPRAPFSELHTKTVGKPIDEVWPACLDVTAQEVRTLGPLMRMRDLPKLLGAGRKVPVGAPKPLIDVFVENGFVLIRRDEAPVDGRATILFGAVGKFWSPAHNAPIAMTASELLDFSEPDYAKTVARLEAFDLGDELASLPGELPQGRRRLLGVARAMAASPAVLLLDEPAAGMNDTETERLLNLLVELPTARRLGLLIIDHDMGLIMRLCERLHVLASGRTIAEGDRQAVREHPDVIEAYLGSETADA